MEYLEDNCDTGQHEDRIYNSSLSRITEVHTDPEYLGSSYSYNLLIEWETGEMTWEPLCNIIADDRYSCAAYAKKFDLLDTQGLKQLQRHARTAKRLSELLRNQSTDKTRYPGDISMDGKFQGIMLMPYNLMFRMVITKERCY